MNTRTAISGVGCDQDGKALQRTRPGGLLTGPLTELPGTDRDAARLTTAGGFGPALVGWQDMPGLGDAPEASQPAVGAAALSTAATSTHHRTLPATADLPAAGAWTDEDWRDVVPAGEFAAERLLSRAASLSLAARLWGNAVPMARETYAVREAATFARADHKAKASMRRQVRSRGPSLTEPPA